MSSLEAESGIGRKVVRDAHINALSLYFAFYDFVRIHGSLLVSPAMAAGITDRRWSKEDIAKLVEAAGKAPGKREPDRKHCQDDLFLTCLGSRANIDIISCLERYLFAFSSRGLWPVFSGNPVRGILRVCYEECDPSHLLRNNWHNRFLVLAFQATLGSWAAGCRGSNRTGSLRFHEPGRHAQPCSIAHGLGHCRAGRGKRGACKEAGSYRNNRDTSGDLVAMHLEAVTNPRQRARAQLTRQRPACKPGLYLHVYKRGKVVGPMQRVTLTYVLVVSKFQPLKAQ